jgi:hypothetical protein
VTVQQLIDLLENEADPQAEIRVHTDEGEFGVTGLDPYDTVSFLNTQRIS